jgi:hypothetical protein
LVHEIDIIDRTADEVYTFDKVIHDPPFKSSVRLLDDGDLPTPRNMEPIKPARQ